MTKCNEWCRDDCDCGTPERSTPPPTCLACIMAAEDYCIEIAMSFADFDDVYWEFHETCLDEAIP